MGRGAARKNEAGLAEPAESLEKLPLAALGHRRQQLVREFPPDRSGDLGDFLGCLAEAIETRHQRCLQRRRHRRGRRSRAGKRLLDPFAPASSTALVSSSRKSGMPSARSTIYAAASLDYAALPAMRSTIAALVR
jgi:hypothetical protein